MQTHEVSIFVWTQSRPGQTATLPTPTTLFALLFKTILSSASALMHVNPRILRENVADHYGLSLIETSLH